MKKFSARFCALLAAVLIACAAPLSALAADTAAAPTYGSMLVLGDSITTGYGLDNYTPGASPYECQSYANLLAASLGLMAKTTYINRAVNGYTSGDVRALLPTLRSIAEESDLIILSVGGNDLLHHIFTIASAVSGTTVSDYDKAIPALVAADASAFSALSSNIELMTSIAKSLTECAANLDWITATLRQYNPTARIIFLEQYNPLALGASPIAATIGDLPAKLNAVSAFVSPFLDRINQSIREAVAKNGCESADVPSVINPDPASLTNILKMDIHPNAAGHKAIFDLLSTVCSAGPAATEAPTEAPTAAPTEAPAEAPTEAPTAAPTDAPATEPAGKAGGCKSVLLPLPLLFVLPAGFAAIKKKKD